MLKIILVICSAIVLTYLFFVMQVTNLFSKLFLKNPVMIKKPVKIEETLIGKILLYAKIW